MREKGADPRFDAAARAADVGARLVAARGEALARALVAGGFADPEAVHDLRVASRRLRETLATFRDAAPRKLVQRAVASAKEVTRAFGTTRNADVGAALLREIADESPAAAPAALSLAGHLASRAGRLRRKAEAAFAGGEAETLRRRVGRVVAALERGAGAPAGAERPVGDLAREALARRVARLYRREPAWGDPGAVRALHATRIAAKRLRYAVEIFEPLFVSGYADQLGRLKKIQDELGAHHDVVLLLDEASDWEASDMPAMAGADRIAWRALEARLLAERRRRHARFLALIAPHTEAAFEALLLETLGPRPGESAAAPAPPAATGAREARVS